MPDVPVKLAAQEEGVERNSFCQSHTDDGLDKHLAGSTRIAANSFNSLGANEPHTDSGGGTSDGPLQTVVEISFDCGDNFDHFIYCLGFLF